MRRLANLLVLMRLQETGKNPETGSECWKCSFYNGQRPTAGNLIGSILAEFEADCVRFFPGLENPYANPVASPQLGDLRLLDK